MKLSYAIGRQLQTGVEAFVQVSLHRSFKAAAKELGISPSAVSQQIRALEDHVGVALLSRTTRSVGLTQAGQIFLARAQPAMAELSSAYDEARNLTEPAGLLRLYMPHGVIPMLVEPIISGFCAAYPKVDVEIIGGEQPVNLVEGGFDAGVQLGETLDRDMIAIRLTAPIHFLVVGAPRYFEMFGVPLQPADLRHHQCLRLLRTAGEARPWVFVEAGRSFEIRVAGRLTTNDTPLGIAAARSGMGLCYVSEKLVRPFIESGELRIVLSDYMPGSEGLFLHYPSRRQVLPKLRIFIEFFRSKLQGGDELIAL